MALDAGIANTVDKSKWSKLDETLFQLWYSAMAQANKLDPNPDAPEHHYDYRAYYQEAQPLLSRGGYQPEHEQYRFPDKFKKADHPNIGDMF